MTSEEFTRRANISELLQNSDGFDEIQNKKTDTAPAKKVSFLYDTTISEDSKNVHMTINSDSIEEAKIGTPQYKAIISNAALKIYSERTSKSDAEREAFRELERSAKKIRIEKDAIPGALKKIIPGTQAITTDVLKKMKEGTAARVDAANLKINKKKDKLEKENLVRIESQNLAQLLFDKARNGENTSNPNSWKDMTLKHLKAAYAILVPNKTKISKKCEYQVALKVPIALLLRNNNIAIPIASTNNNVIARNSVNNNSVTSSSDSDSSSDSGSD